MPAGATAAGDREGGDTPRGHPQGPLPCPGSGEENKQTSAPLLVGPTLTPPGVRRGAGGLADPLPNPLSRLGVGGGGGFGLFKCPWGAGLSISQAALPGACPLGASCSAAAGTCPRHRRQTLDPSRLAAPRMRPRGDAGGGPRHPGPQGPRGPGQRAGSREGRGTWGSGAECGVQPYPESPSPHRSPPSPRRLWSPPGTHRPPASPSMERGGLGLASDRSRAAPGRGEPPPSRAMPWGPPRPRRLVTPRSLQTPSGRRPSPACPIWGTPLRPSRGRRR